MHGELERALHEGLPARVSQVRHRRLYAHVNGRLERGGHLSVRRLVHGPHSVKRESSSSFRTYTSSTTPFREEICDNLSVRRFIHGSHSVKTEVVIFPLEDSFTDQTQ